MTSTHASRDPLGAGRTNQVVPAGRRSPPASGPTPGSPADDGPDADPREVARLICLRQLTAGPRSRAQLAAALGRRGVPEEAAVSVLDRFTELGLVDDGQFARMWVQTRHRGRGLGRRALTHELRARGVPDPDTDAALAELSPGQEEQTARQLVQRRLPALAHLDPVVVVRRLSALLARKGYPAGLAVRVVREELGERARTIDLPEG